MSAEDRYMYLFVFFDLPVKTKPQRKAANNFRKFLKKNGFMMIQLSVYARVCKGTAMADTYTAKVRANLTKRGSVRTLLVTEKQYGRMEFMLGELTVNERKAGGEQLVLL